jgi:hypothetical protein
MILVTIVSGPWNSNQLFGVKMFWNLDGYLYAIVIVSQTVVNDNLLGCANYCIWLSAHRQLVIFASHLYGNQAGLPKQDTA